MKSVRPTACDEARRAELESVLQSISSAQEDAARGFRPDASTRKVGSSGCPDDAAATSPPADGAPLLAPESVRVDRDRFAGLLAEVLNILRRWTGDARHNEAIAKIQISDEYRAILVADAIRGGGALQGRGEDHEVDGDVFALAVRYALAPFLSAYARELADRFDPEAILGGRCPVCGAEPFMAELDREDGRRLLACGLCATRWRAARMKCPFCGSEDQQKLGFLEVEGIEGYRADVCEGCRRYLKTVDRRRVDEPIALDLADALTPELDEAALDRGFGLPAATGTDKDGRDGQGSLPAPVAGG